MAMKRHFLAAKTPLELVDRRIVDGIDSFQIIARAALRQRPFNYRPLAGLADMVLAEIAVEATPDLMQAPANAHDKKARAELAILARYELRSFHIFAAG